MDIKKVNPISPIDYTHNNKKERRQQRPKNNQSFKDVFEQTKLRKKEEEKER